MDLPYGIDVRATVHGLDQSARVSLDDSRGVLRELEESWSNFYLTLIATVEDVRAGVPNGHLPQSLDFSATAALLLKKKPTIDSADFAINLAKTIEQARRARRQFAEATLCDRSDENETARARVRQILEGPVTVGTLLELSEINTVRHERLEAALKRKRAADAGRLRESPVLEAVDSVDWTESVLETQASVDDDIETCETHLAKLRKLDTRGHPRLEQEVRELTKEIETDKETRFAGQDHLRHHRLKSFRTLSDRLKSAVERLHAFQEHLDTLARNQPEFQPLADDEDFRLRFDTFGAKIFSAEFPWSVDQMQRLGAVARYFNPTHQALEHGEWRLGPGTETRGLSQEVMDRDPHVPPTPRDEGDIQARVHERWVQHQEDVLQRHAAVAAKADDPNAPKLYAGKPRTSYEGTGDRRTFLKKYACAIHSDAKAFCLRFASIPEVYAMQNATRLPARVDPTSFLTRLNAWLSGCTKIEWKEAAIEELGGAVIYYPWAIDGIELSTEPFRGGVLDRKGPSHNIPARLLVERAKKLRARDGIAEEEIDRDKLRFTTECGLIIIARNVGSARRPFVITAYRP